MLAQKYGTTVKMPVLQPMVRNGIVAPTLSAVIIYSTYINCYLTTQSFTSDAKCSKLKLFWGWCCFPSTGQTKAGQPRYFPSMVDGKEDSLSVIFHPHGLTMCYSHTAYRPGGRTYA